MQFLNRLNEVLVTLASGQWLILQREGSDSDWVQFAAQGRHGYRLEAKSNWYRCGDDQLSPQQVSTLSALGWLLPTGSDEESTPDADPNGSPNFYRDLAPKLKLEDLESLVAVTFQEVLGVPQPNDLHYEAFERDGSSLPLPSLGLKPVMNSEDADLNKKLPSLLLTVAKEVTGLDDLAWDSDGDISGITFGGIAAYLRIVEGSSYFRIYSPLLMDVEETPALLAKINELNTCHGFMHLCVMHGDCVMAVSDVLTVPFISRYVATAMGNFLQLAREFASELIAEFGADAVMNQQPLWH